MPRKICVVVTARPSYSRVRSALKAICAHPDIELQLVVAASALLDRYGSAVRSIEEDGFEIAARIYNVIEGENVAAMAKTTGLGLIELASAFAQLRPDCVVSIADRYETIATAIAASYMNIPLAHIQGGEITGSIDEKVRHAVTKLADLHLVASERARQRVIGMGEDPTQVFNTGCPSIDLARRVLEQPELDFDPFAKYGGDGTPLDLSQGYLVVLQHPVTSELEQSQSHVTETLFAVHNIGLPTLWFWPNPDAGSDGTSRGIRSFRKRQNAGQLRFFLNMLPLDFLRLAYHSKAIVGNSSVAIRECAFLGVPAVDIGNRQRGRDRGRNVVQVAHQRMQIEHAILKQINHGRFAPDRLYGDGTAGQQVAAVLSTAELRTEKRLYGLEEDRWQRPAQVA